MELIHYGGTVTNASAVTDNFSSSIFQTVKDDVGMG